MKFENFRNRSIEEWRQIEADQHDLEYVNTFPFGQVSLEFTVEQALWYNDYSYKKGRRLDRGDRTRKFLKLLDLDNIEGLNILDIGSGNGAYSVLFAKCGANVTGIELSPIGTNRAKEIAKANNVEDKCSFIDGDFTMVDLPENKFDVVLLHEVLHHAIKYPQLQEKIEATLKPGGRLLITESLRGSNLIEYYRQKTKKARQDQGKGIQEYEENLGDVQITLEDVKEFASYFKSSKFYLMHYFYMFKESKLKNHRDKLFVRLFLRMCRYADIIFLNIFPFMRKHCGEVIIDITN